jgi:hypothetical protein
MERKKDKRFVETSNEEIESKRLKMNAEKTLKQNESTDTRLREYLIERKKDTKFEDYDTLKLDEVLSHFYVDALLYD